MNISRMQKGGLGGRNTGCKAGCVTGVGGEKERGRVSFDAHSIGEHKKKVKLHNT